MQRNFIIGMILMIISAYPLFLIVQENVLDSYVNSRYEIKEFIDIRNMRHRVVTQVSNDLASPIIWRNNTVEVITKDTGRDAPTSNNQNKRIKQIIIKINGMEESLPTEALLPQKITKDSDFLSWLNILEIKDKKSNKEKLAIVQRLVNDWNNREVEHQKWRILYVDEDMRVTEETFSYIDRGKHLLGVKLLLDSSESTTWIGYKSDIAYTLPSILFPLIYPTGTFLIGIVVLITWSNNNRKKRLVI
ncbi:hypothetical protein [Paenibacillus sp. OAS669]|uniref:hypothetical protein n=1 Tax=Paenibacillus sp. OAS669 TaxID=2663821 RepID=UPI00178943A1|nr:hypothetical protein [Paenibacillus sp. OAS669]MBE1445549.1 hypothetical protein [Paenibacillus sp. OAS669]